MAQTFDLDLSDPRVWDDTVLVESWNEALEEYKKYHSIHAQGKRLEDVLTDEELVRLKMKRPPREPVKEIQVHDVVQEDDVNMAIAGEEREPQVPTNMTNGTTESHAPQKEQSASKKAPVVATMPQTLLANVQDDNLKNLMMSWYYAGYYTGLYEGQQKSK
ncbi:hypothetical protein EJ08DRAFT_588712 [Tothia fuscella]|uniref:Survival motor neuron Tudor domain-containing protein n=1 Tax=Tothia fuscella TaxID=1048955 RepID=A0A9P4NS45_9PEZI|nr:hypothetical protein EJ08DRAFT_588712 [Tothia fuscella]